MYYAAAKGYVTGTHGSNGKDYDYWEASAFVTGGALFSIKSVGRNREHVVALDTDAVNDRTHDSPGLGGFG